MKDNLETTRDLPEVVDAKTMDCVLYRRVADGGYESIVMRNAFVAALESGAYSEGSEFRQRAV